VDANAAIGAVRFAERTGLGRAQLMRTTQAIAQALRRGPGERGLAGLDVMGSTPRHSEASKAYRLAADLIKTLTAV